MRFISVLGAAVWLALLASHAEAAVAVTLVDRGVPTDGSNVATGFQSWLIRLTSDSGNLNGIDLETSGHGLFGPLVQRWPSSLSDGVYDAQTAVHVAQNITPRAENFDSHLLHPTIPQGPPPPFESLGSGSFPPVGSSVGGGMPTNTNAWGIGISGPNGFIKGAFYIPGPEQGPILDLAYLVLRNGELDQLSGRVAVATPGGVFEVVIPEPQGFAFVILGAGAARLNRWRVRCWRRSTC
jgi:hypothetical protein